MIIADVEAVVSYQVVTIALLSILTAVVGWAGKSIFSKLNAIESNLQVSAIEREGIRGKLDVINKEMQHLHEKIDLKREVRDLQTLVVRAAQLPIKEGIV